MIAHLDLDAFFASIEQRDHPKLKNKPLVVGFVTPYGDKCNRGVVSAASYEVRKYGVCSGMSLWQAKKLCPSLVVISGNFGKYKEASRQMHQIICSYSPNVEILSLDEAFISFYDCEKLYSDLISVCQEIKIKIKSKIGITGSIGLASNKVVAKIASDFKKPDGLTVVAKGNEKQFLAPLLIDKLYGVGPAIKTKLTSFNIKTIGQLADLDKDFLISLFGKYGQTLWYFANGISSIQINPHMPNKSIGRSITFPVNSNNLSYLQYQLAYLSEKTASALRHEGTMAGCIKLTLRDESFDSWSHQQILSSKITTAYEILNLSKMLLDRAWDKVTPLRLLGITLSDLLPVPLQLSLFLHQPGISFPLSIERRKILEESVDKIREKFGFWTIRPASIQFLKENII